MSTNNKINNNNNNNNNYNSNSLSISNGVIKTNFQNSRVIKIKGSNLFSRHKIIPILMLSLKRLI